MQLTKKGEYALRMLIRLGVARRMGRDVVSVSTLAESEKLPFKFLEQILGLLRQEGYVESKRGKQGGAMLARPMEQIKIGDVVRLIDGRLAPIGCASETDYEKCTCPDETHCGLRMLMIDVRNAISRILDRYTLADVVAVTIRKMERDGVVMPFAAPAAAPAKAARASKKPAKQPRRANPEDGFLNWLLGKPLNN
jgi:Rrf2 family protein